MTDEKIIQGCIKNSRKAQNSLFKQFERRVFGICLRYSNSIEEARDVQQETFIKIFHSFLKKPEINSLESWIIRITVNTAIDFLRKRKRLSETEMDDTPLGSEPAILEKLNEDELILIIRSISDPYRSVFNLYVIEGYNHAEIAKLMEINESTSRSYLSWAKEMIRNKLNREEKKMLLYGTIG